MEWFSPENEVILTRNGVIFTRIPPEFHPKTTKLARLYIHTSRRRAYVYIDRPSFLVFGWNSGGILVKTRWKVGGFMGKVGDSGWKSGDFRWNWGDAHQKMRWFSPEMGWFSPEFHRNSIRNQKTRALMYTYVSQKSVCIHIPTEFSCF